MTQREQLYYLIEHYMLGDYDTHTFSDEFSLIYSRVDAKDEETLFSTEERRLFKEFSNIAERVSCYREDLQKHPGVYFTECDVRRKTIEVCKKLSIKY